MGQELGSGIVGWRWLWSSREAALQWPLRWGGRASFKDGSPHGSCPRYAGVSVGPRECPYPRAVTCSQGRWSPREQERNVKAFTSQAKNPHPAISSVSCWLHTPSALVLEGHQHPGTNSEPASLPHFVNQLDTVNWILSLNFWKRKG